MNQSVRYNALTIPKKLRVDIRITVDDKGAEYTSTFETNNSTGINIYPIISISLSRLGEMDDSGKYIRPPYDPNDVLSMTKHTFVYFIMELISIQNDLKIKELYSYHGKRLEINDKISDKITRTFRIGDRTNVELSPTILSIVENADEQRIEGIKMKFNVEKSHVLLTLNELDSLIYNLQHIDVDVISMLMYLNYVNKPVKQKFFDQNTLQKY